MDLHKELANWDSISYLDDVQLSDGLLSGALKCALLVACSDMGARLPYVCSAVQANLLTFQNFGHRTSQGGIAETIEQREVSNLIVFGHSDCEFARFLAKPKQQDEVGQDLISKHFKSESDNLVGQYGLNLSEDEHLDWNRISEWCVLNELRSLLAHPQALQRTRTKQLKLHGWVYDANANCLRIFDPKSARFVEAKSKTKKGGTVKKQ